jgi:hypothetical protein
MRGMKRLALVAALGACGGGDSGEPPLAIVEAQLGALAINNTSFFAIDKADSKVLEIGLANGVMVGKLPSIGAVSEVAAFGTTVAWVEVEGSGKVIKRRKADGTVDSTRPQTSMPKIIANADGVIYSDGMLVALWKEDGSNPERIAITDGNSRVLGADLTSAFTLEADTSVKKWPRNGDPGSVVLPMTKDATVLDAELAHRTSEGIRQLNLTTGFDRVVGMPPADYVCKPLIAGRATLCGKYRAMDGMTTELLDDDPDAYAAIGRIVVWVKTNGTKSELHKVDAELAEK